jgi:hypothetical protein|tara:strand:+ start:50 stop:1105 length:1056 start_codon:yes stop_codon:yes gene_type:complete
MNKHNFTLTVFIGDVNIKLSELAKVHDQTAFLICHLDCNEFLNSELVTNTTIYTSLGDMDEQIESLVELLQIADVIVYCPPDTWSDNKIINIANPTSCLHGLTEQCLFLSNNKNIKNFKFSSYIPDPIKLVDCRKSEKKQLWIAGSSVSYGHGVDCEQSYGYLLSAELNLPVSMIAIQGSSIAWASDQLIRSDIRKNDIVVFGLTKTERVTYVTDKCKIMHIHKVNYHPRLKRRRDALEALVPEKTLYTQDTIYTQFYAIKRLINFCNKLGVHLIIIGLTASDNIVRLLQNEPTFHSFPYNEQGFDGVGFPMFEDRGTDGWHPGPNQHIAYKNFILKLINELMWWDTVLDR